MSESTQERPFAWPHDHPLADEGGEETRSTEDVGNDIADWAAKSLPGFYEQVHRQDQPNSLAVFRDGDRDGYVDKYRVQGKSGNVDPTWQMFDREKRPDHEEESKIIEIERGYKGFLGSFVGIAWKPDQDISEGCDAGINLENIGSSIRTGFQTAQHEMIGHCGLSDMLSDNQRKQLLGNIADAVPYDSFRKWIGEDLTDEYLNATGMTEHATADGNYEVRAADDGKRTMSWIDPRTGNSHLSRKSIENETSTQPRGDPQVGTFVEEALLHKLLTHTPEGHAHAVEAERGGPIPEGAAKWPTGGEQDVVDWAKGMFLDIEKVYRKEGTYNQFQNRYHDALGPDDDRWARTQGAETIGLNGYPLVKNGSDPATVIAQAAAKAGSAPGGGEDRSEMDSLAFRGLEDRLATRARMNEVDTGMGR